MSKQISTAHPALFFPGLFLIGLALQGCSVGSSEFSRAAFNRPAMDFPTSSSDLKARIVYDSKIPHANVACSNPVDCQPAIGLVSSTQSPSAQSKITYCGGFLVSPNAIILSQLCLAKDLGRAGSDAEKRIWIHFPAAQGFDARTVEGSRVISAFLPSGLAKKEELETGFVQPQYAVVQLREDVNRPYLQISREGLQDHVQYEVAQVILTDRVKRWAEVHTTRCRVVQGSKMMPRAAHDFSSNSFLADCALLESDRGSPILDQEGRVRGIINEIYPSTEPNSIQVNVATNFACAVLPEEIAPFQLQNDSSRSSNLISNECPPVVATDSLSHGQILKRHEASLRKRVEEASQTEIKTILSQLDDSFEWKMVSLDLLYKTKSNLYADEELVAIPSCVKDILSFVNAFRNWQDDYLFQAEHAVVLPRYRLSFKRDQFFVYSPVIERVGAPIYDRFKFSPMSLASTRKTQMSLVGTTWELGSCSNYK